MISDEELERLYDSMIRAVQHDGPGSIADIALRLLSAYRELKAENERDNRFLAEVCRVSKEQIDALKAKQERLINLSVALESELTAMEGSNNALMKVVIAAYDLGYQVEDGPNTEDFWKVYREALSLEVRKSIVDLKS